MESDITKISSKFLDILSRNHQAVPPALVGAALELIAALNADELLRATEPSQNLSQWAARRQQGAVEPEPPLGGEEPAAS